MGIESEERLLPLQTPSPSRKTSSHLEGPFLTLAGCIAKTQAVPKAIYIYEKGAQKSDKSLFLSRDDEV